MRKHLLFTVAVFMLMIGCVSAQDTITGWTFPVAVGTDSLNANLGLPGNLGYDVRVEDTTGNDYPITLEEGFGGPGDYAATAIGWDNGSLFKYWSIKFKATGYSNIKVSSKQRSGGTNPGPRDFKLQWRLSGEDFQDIPGGSVTVADDWTTGVVTDLPAPITNPGSSSLYINWILTSNLDINGNTLLADGYSKIDEIIVTGTPSTGQEEVLFSNLYNIYPNPSQGIFTVQAVKEMQQILVTDLSGRILVQENEPGYRTTIDLSGMHPGTCFVRITLKAMPGKRLINKIVIQ